MSLPKIKYQQLTYVVKEAGQEITIDAETDKLYKNCTGINVIVSNDNAKYSTLQLQLNGTEIFPDGFEVVRIKFRESAPFGYDYHQLEEPAAGSRILGKFKDKSQGGYPYTVTISLRLENSGTPTKEEETKSDAKK